MSIKDFENIELTKWPLMLVKGEKVTEDQAAEIIIRTSNFYFSTNDRDFEKELYSHIYGVYSDHFDIADKIAKRDNISLQEAQKKEASINQSYGLLCLNYLSNERIASCWIGGPHGWCDWQGNIFCNTHNIGKWPNVTDVYKEWKMLAKAFPFLDLTCQLCPEEGKEAPIIEYRIKNGKVYVSKPKDRILENGNTDDFIMNSLTRGYKREHGCTIEQFKRALEITRTRLKK